ncbi:uncharacterized protein isoform X2 [Choristoneura fumiferana]|uniref:uncharacterized protein isoform X2 n=1 Tax=Choristoneura fumiferana TaxID=7141 RepID=UPI003D15E926
MSPSQASGGSNNSSKEPVSHDMNYCDPINTLLLYIIRPALASMGAKQSKRSVDISGKEAESAGEVAAAGAGGEGRVEAIADADALKPQLNGDAHIQPPQELSDKEKQLDSGTPENEKDATTEKESKEGQNDEKEANPVTNGDSELKEENGDSVPTPEDSKKPKKEKLKKKWSLRSISFSRKDKPKQEKKPKEEEPKTNGEPEKVPEEAAEATQETVENKVADVVKVDAEVKEEQTPETPVTEPLTNGSSTPESPKVETLASDEAAPAPVVEQPPATPALETTPEQLPVNGLSLEETKKEAPEVAPIEESKPEDPTPVAKETDPVPEIPVKTEVCDAKMPLIEPTPPPLPANPPPSSVASFAATTMAPELIEASLANTTENAIFTPPTIPDTKADIPDEIEVELSKTNTNTDLAISQISPPLKETVSEDKVSPLQTEIKTVDPVPEISEKETVKMEPMPSVEMVQYESADEVLKTETMIKAEVDILKEAEVDCATTEMIIENKATDATNAADVSNVISEVNGALAANTNSSLPVQSQNQVADNVAIEKNEDCIVLCSEKTVESPEPISDVPDSIDELPPPPPIEDIDNIQREDKVIEYPSETIENAMNINHNIVKDAETNGIINETEQNQIKNLKKDALGNIIDDVECNGNAVSEESVPKELTTSAAATSVEEMVNGKTTTPDDSLPPSLSEAPAAGSDASDSLPPPPADLADPDDDSLRLQDPLPIAEKIADLMPEIPTVPELKTETLQETSSEVAVAD